MLNEFLTESLYPLETRTKNMFGNTSFYIGNKIMLATREKKDNPIDNGIWIGTSQEHHASLKMEFPSIRKLQIYKIKKWLLLPLDADDFEESAIKMCELIKQGDERIGVVVEK